MRSRTLWFLVGALLVSILALGGIGVVIARMHTASGTANTVSAAQQPAALGITHVLIRNEAFQPAHLQVPVGTVVTWTNQDTVFHTVTIAHSVTSTQDIWASGQLSSGESFSYTFMSRGTFTYNCSDHPFIMTGVVTVT
jgi:plastocyanin